MTGGPGSPGNALFTSSGKELATISGAQPEYDYLERVLAVWIKCAVAIKQLDS
jgi:hypothetical protein